MPISGGRGVGVDMMEQIKSHTNLDDLVIVFRVKRVAGLLILGYIP